MSGPSPLQACLPVRPVVLVAAVRGALGRQDAAAVETARSIRDHRDDLPDGLVADLLAVITGAPPGAAHSHIWTPVLAELRRPSRSQRARTRAARFERINP